MIRFGSNNKIKLAMGIRIGIGLRIGGRKAGGFDPATDTNFWGVGRSGLTIPDYHGNDASILLPHINVTTDVYLSKTQTSFQQTDSSGFVEAYVYVDQTNLFYVFSSALNTNNVSYFHCLVSTAGKPYISIRSASTFTNNFITDNAVSVGWHKIKWLSTGTAYKIYVDDEEVACSVLGGANDGKWLSSIAAATTRVSIGVALTATIGKSPNGKLAWVNYNNEHKWYLTGSGKYEFDNIGASHMTYTGSALPIFGIFGTDYLLSTGYTRYTKDGELDEYVPYASTDTPDGTPTELSTYIKDGDKPGIAEKHNLAPSRIDFDPLDTAPSGVANFDRSDAAIWKDACRAASDYDVANAYRWHPLNIADPAIYQAWLETAYLDKIITAITEEDGVILAIDELMSLK